MMKGPSHRQTSCVTIVKKVAQLIHDLQRASLRPLYIEIALHKQRTARNRDGTPDDGSHIKFDAFTGTSNEPVLRIERSWVEVKVYHALFRCCCAVSKTTMSLISNSFVWILM